MIACAGCGCATAPNAPCGYCGHVNGVLAGAVPPPPPGPAPYVPSQAVAPTNHAYPAPPAGYGPPAQYGQAAVGYPSAPPPRSRTAYILLGIFLGGLGIHNFYAGRAGVAVTQLLLMVFLGWTIVVAVGIWIWVIVEVCSVRTDGRGHYLV